MKKLLLSVIVLSAVLMSCGDDDSPSAALTSDLTLNISGLENLGDDYIYEGWVIVEGAPVSTGTFSVDESGALSNNSFSITSSVLELASKFVLSIEPVGETGAAALAPSNTKILGGDFTDNSASVNIMDGAAFGTGFGAVGGDYILATPTSSATDDELKGVWFLNNSTGSAVAGLTNLPDLSENAGWTYEGWVVVNGTQAYSTGTFNKASGADDNATTSLTKGTDGNGPGYPGEDFLNNLPDDFPTDLSGAVVVVSIEPVPDNSANPFTLKPLLGEVPTTPVTGVVYSASNIAAGTYPSGTVTR